MNRSADCATAMHRFFVLGWYPKGMGHGTRSEEEEDRNACVPARLGSNDRADSHWDMQSGC